MKKLVALLMLLSLSVYTIGCTPAGQGTGNGTDTTEEATPPAGSAEPALGDEGGAPAESETP